MSLGFIMAEVKRQLHVSISYWTAWHARLKCLQDIHGDYGASYNMVPVLCDQDLDRQIMPPPHFRGIGRPKKARTRGKDEEVRPKKKMKICSKCKQPGHNAKTCKCLPAAKKGKNVNESPEETQASQASTPAPDSTQASQTSTPAPDSTQASQTSALAPDSIPTSQAKRVCSKCKQPRHNVKTCKGKQPLECKESAPTEALKESSAASTPEPPTPKPNSKVSATKSNAKAAPKSTPSSSSSTPQPAAEPATLTFEPTRVTISKTAKVFKV
ncbi:hypothetical protein IFM89_026394 [Coptis chinensis]|uniref:CCHC-type domain-containing protein n=1 Tax=Coptis chinensis TaxID=261450 RepID=A0A835I6T3_9MAGN|nr:hypothetical protein IFM89_026394 [Coptis chinensis]